MLQAGLSVRVLGDNDNLVGIEALVVGKSASGLELCKTITEGFNVLGEKARISLFPEKDGKGLILSVPLEDFFVPLNIKDWMVLSNVEEISFRKGWCLYGIDGVVRGFGINAPNYAASCLG